MKETDDARDVVRQTVASFGGVDVVFNNAGIQPCNLPLLAVPSAAWDQR